jgi:hypothetical protein
MGSNTPPHWRSDRSLAKGSAVQVNTSEAHAAASTLHEQSLVAQLDELADRQRYEDYYYKGDPADPIGPVPYSSSLCYRWSLTSSPIDGSEACYMPLLCPSSGVALARHWPGPALARHWPGTGPALARHWPGTGPARHWPGPALARHRPGTGPALAQPDTGPAPARHWPGTGPAPALARHLARLSCARTAFARGLPAFPQWSLHRCAQDRVFARRAEPSRALGWHVPLMHWTDEC